MLYFWNYIHNTLKDIQLSLQSIKIPQTVSEFSFRKVFFPAKVCGYFNKFTAFDYKFDLVIWFIKGFILVLKSSTDYNIDFV